MLDQPVSIDIWGKPMLYQAALERMVDNLGLDASLEMLSQICKKKAEHIAVNWADPHLAKLWDGIADDILDLANQWSKIDA